MPTLSNQREYVEQTTSLPLKREMSSIPRGDSDSNWEYPSPQQMYNAMLRKGYTDTPVDAVEAMVAVHNFLNEGAWEEIVCWEDIFSHGLRRGWELCRKGEQGLAEELARQRYLKQEQQRRKQLMSPSSSSSPPLSSKAGSKPEDVEPRLVRFQGRPGDPSPKARMYQWLAWAFPERYDDNPPFDRHDWYVSRHTPSGVSKEVRYVIDYYAGGVQATGEPVFYLDIRPALDTPTAAIERMMRWSGDVWHRASGADARAKKRKSS